MAVKKYESTEGKIVWNLGRFIKNLFLGNRTKNHQNKIEFDRSIVTDRWESINILMKKIGPENFQTAVLNADKLLDYCLRGLGASGETIGERLKGGESLFRDRISYQAAWDGHKLRNTLVHDHETEVLFYQAKGAIEQYRKALGGLRVL